MPPDRDLPTGGGRRPAPPPLPIATPNLAGLPADATAEEARSAIIRDLEAAGLPLRRIARIFGTTVATIREDRSVPPRPARGDRRGRPTP